MNIVDNAKEIAKLVKKYNDQELYEKIADLRDQILELREDLHKAQTDNHKLKKEVSTLEMKLEEKGNVQYEKPSYWVVEGDSKDGPFCQKCYDADNKLVRLQDGKDDFWICRECKTSYRGQNYTPIKPQVRSSGLGKDGWMAN